MKVSKKEILPVIAVFLLFILLAFRSYFFKGLVPVPGNLLVAFYQPWASYQSEGFGNVAHKPIGFDNLRIFYPLRKLSIEEIKAGSWPLWNPYSFSGNTQLATYQSAIFHPLSFLFLVLPQVDAWSVIVVLGPFFAGIFMYLFLREIVLNKRASLFGACVFAFSSFILVWTQESFMSEYSAIFLPLALLGSEKLLKGFLQAGFVTLTIALSFSILSGWFQMTFYVFLFTVIWTGARFLFSTGKKAKNLYLLATIASFFTALCISGIHLVPGIEAYLQSPRGTTDAKFIFDAYLLPLKNLATLFVPDFFGNPGSYNYFGGGFYYERVISVGILPLIFAFFTLFSLRKKSSPVEKFFAVAFLVTLSLGFSLPTSWFLLYYLKLPLLSTILPSRIFFLSSFCSAVLAAFGMEKYLAGRIEKKTIAAVFVGFAACFITLWGYVLYYKYGNFTDRYSMNVASISLKNLLLPTGFFIIGIILVITSLIQKKFTQKLYIVFVALVFLNALYFANKYFYFSNRSNIFPKVGVITKLQELSGIDRFWSFGQGYIERNFATYYHLNSPEGYDSFYISRYGELMAAAQSHGEFREQIPRTDATFSYADKASDILTDPYRKKLLSLLGVKYIAGLNENIKSATVSNELKPIWHDSIYTIYNYIGAYPRMFLAGDFQVQSGNQKILNSMFSPQIDLAKTVILEEQPKGFTGSKDISGTVKNIIYKPNNINADVAVDKAALLFISDNFYPGWGAYVDGAKTDIYRADYSFRAIVVPVGLHKVTLEYRPNSFTLGIWVTVLGLLMSVVIALKIKRYEYKA